MLALRLSESAVLDLEELIGYYERKLVPEVGVRLVEEILSKSKS